MEIYLKQVQETISSGNRWEALRLVRDARYHDLSREQQNDLYDLEILAEESR